MTEEDQNTNQESQKATVGMLQSISNNAARLGIFALLSTLFIAGTQWQTKDEIAEQQRKAQLRALLEIVPESEHDNDMLQDFILIDDEVLGLRDEQKVFLARQHQQPKVLIYPAIARDGYSGDIAYIVGVSLSDISHSDNGGYDSVAGVRVLAHRETPGLGDAIELRKSDWILSFNGKSLLNPPEDQWTVKKDGGLFDAFTGATITPRALTQSVANTLRYHRQHKKELLKQFEQNSVEN